VATYEHDGSLRAKMPEDPVVQQKVILGFDFSPCKRFGLLLVSVFAILASGTVVVKQLRYHHYSTRDGFGQFQLP
jgi:hypothetical protein